MISLNPPCEILPNHCQLCAPCPKASGNAFQALVDPPHDGNNISLDGGDESTNGSDGNTVVNEPPHNPGLPASPYSQDIATAIQEWLQEIQDSLISSCPRTIQPPPGLPQILELSESAHMLLIAIRDRNAKAQCATAACLTAIEDEIDAAWTENTTLREAYRASREETEALKATVDTLIKKLDENIAISAPPSLGTATTSTTMEEMMMQLSYVQNHIQDVLDIVHNYASKRK
jgi:hypothetical protein